MRKEMIEMLLIVFVGFAVASNLYATAHISDKVARVRYQAIFSIGLLFLLAYYLLR